MTSRLKRYLRHGRSRRFLLSLIAAALFLAALSTDGLLSWLLGAAGMTALLVVLLVLSVRVSELSRRLDLAQADRVPEPSLVGDHKDEIEEANAVSARLSDAVETLHPMSTTGAPDSLEAPRVTVLIPCFNEQKYVAQAIESVRRQSFQNWECIVVDDASTDSSVSEIWKSIEGDNRFRLLRHKVNGGLGAARNTGLRTAQGRFITFLDSDDLLMGDSLLERVITLSESLDDPHVIGSYCGIQVELEDVDLDELPPSMGPNKGGIIDFISAEAECPFNAHAPLMFTDKLRDLGGFKESMRHGAEDWDLWYRAMRNGYIFVPAKSVTAVYRQKPTSMVRTVPDGHLLEADRLIAAAFAESAPEIFTVPTLIPLTASLSFYQERIQKAKRAIRFAAMALARGDEETCRRSIAAHTDLPIEILRRHVDVDDLVVRGMMRALAMKQSELREFQTTVDRAQQTMWDLIAASAPSPETIVSRSPKTFRAALLPQYAGQLGKMMDRARELGWNESEIAVVDVSREAGDQGVRDDLVPELDCLSLNQWVLGDYTADTVLVGAIRTAAVDQLARHLTESGASVIELPQPDDDVMRIDEAHRAPLNTSSSESRTFHSLLGGGTTVSGPLDHDPAASWTLEEYPETTVDTDALMEFKDLHKGERVVIIGNGPSLNETDLTKLKDEYTFAVNGIFYAADQMGFDPSYYVVEDTAVMRDNLEAIKAYQAGHKFFPSIYRPLVGTGPNISYFMMNRGFYEPRSPDYCIPRFSFNPGHRVYSGQSVTIINLQLAYFMGFSEVYLIGMDFSYTIPDSADVKGDVITSRGDDPNHFHPDYFGSGKVWKDPKLDRVLANYALAKQIFEADARRIINATVGGNLEIFDRVDFDTAFGV